jgi:hypothetical protein
MLWKRAILRMTLTLSRKRRETHPWTHFPFSAGEHQQQRGNIFPEWLRPKGLRETQNGRVQHVVSDLLRSGPTYAAIGLASRALWMIAAGLAAAGPGGGNGRRCFSGCLQRAADAPVRSRHSAPTLRSRGCIRELLVDAPYHKIPFYTGGEG